MTFQLFRRLRLRECRGLADLIREAASGGQRDAHHAISPTSIAQVRADRDVGRHPPRMDCQLPPEALVSSHRQDRSVLIRRPAHASSLFPVAADIDVARRLGPAGPCTLSSRFPNGKHRPTERPPATGCAEQWIRLLQSVGDDRVAGESDHGS